MEWKNLYRGFVMGISDLIPGVSGGTIAVMLGIYDRVLESISGFFSRDWKKHLKFLLPLGAGMLSAILLLSRLVEYLLNHHYAATQFFFLGLIVGIIPVLLQQSEARTSFTGRHYLIMVIAAAAIGSMAFLTPDSSAEPQTNPSLLVLIGLFLSGWLASMAMLMPGISGSFILLLLGVYPTAIHAVSNLDLLLIAVIGSGVIIGFIVSSKGIRFLLNRYPRLSYAGIIGLIIGSVFVVFPGFANDVVTWIICVLTFAAGLGISWLFKSK